MSVAFCAKHAPKNISELIGDKLTLNAITNWLTNFKKEKFKNLFLIGSTGSGKTCSIDLVLKKLNMDVHGLTDFRMRLTKKGKVPVSKELDDCIRGYLSQLSSGMNILSFMNSKDAVQNVIVVDEMDMEILFQDKVMLLKIIEINQKYQSCPIIFICDKKHKKRLNNELNKKAMILQINPPNDHDLTELMNKILQKEHIRCDDCEVSNSIIDFAQNDYRRLCNVLFDLINDFCGCQQILTMDMFKEYSTIMLEKHMSFDIYKSSEKLLSNYSGIEDCLQLYEMDKVYVPQMVQRNYIYRIIRNQDAKKTSTILKYITNALSTGDIIENYVYGEQKWDLQCVHGFFACGATSYYANLCDLDGPSQQVYCNDMHITSAKRNNKKYMIKASKWFDSIDPLDYIYIYQILSHLVLKNKMSDLIEIMRTYKLNIWDIDEILKLTKNKPPKQETHSIDGKSKTPKLVLTCKQKKVLKEAGFSLSAQPYSGV